VKCRGRRGIGCGPPSGRVHSTTTIATADFGKAYDETCVWQRLTRSGWIGPDETTIRVSGFVIEPCSGRVECQLGGSATVTPAAPTRRGACALAGQARARATRSELTRRMYNSSISTLQLAELVREAQPCVVLTGAGVSTESGIPDFRSPTGIWAQYDPMEYATIDAFRRDPAKVWDFYSRRLGVLMEAEPNPAHLALAELEQRGFVEAVITQNVDRLHERAGSQNVIEVHGSLRTSSCLECGHSESFDRVVELLPVPCCERCGSVLKPDVVMFGELMPEAELDRAFELVRSAALLLVVGSSLEVYPVAGLPEEALAAGTRLAIVNKGPTPYDAGADLRIDAPAGETLAAVVATLPRA
jgi:NAD-dependent deacetylase